MSKQGDWGQEPHGEGTEGAEEEVDDEELVEEPEVGEAEGVRPGAAEDEAQPEFPHGEAAGLLGDLNERVVA